MSNFKTILEQAEVLEKDKKLLEKVLAHQDEELTEKIKKAIEKKPEFLPILVDLIKLKIIGKKDLNKRYLSNLLTNKITEAIS